jgi:hypothetical protein
VPWGFGISLDDNGCASQRFIVGYSSKIDWHSHLLSIRFAAEADCVNVTHQRRTRHYDHMLRSIDFHPPNWPPVASFDCPSYRSRSPGIRGSLYPSASLLSIHGSHAPPFKQAQLSTRPDTDVVTSS